MHTDILVQRFFAMIVQKESQGRFQDIIIETDHLQRRSEGNTTSRGSIKGGQGTTGNTLESRTRESLSLVRQSYKVWLGKQTWDIIECLET